MSNQDDNSDPKKVVDDIVKAIAEDELFIEEEERIIKEEIQKIEKKLDDPNISPEEVEKLQTQLKEKYKRFLQSAKLVNQNSDDLEKEMWNIKKTQEKKQMDNILQTLDKLCQKNQLP